RCSPYSGEQAISTLNQNRGDGNEPVFNMNLFSLKGKVAVVTGSLGLLGKEHCWALADAGANVVVSDLDEDKCREFALTLAPEALGAGADVSDAASVRSLLQKAEDRFGCIDILLNNAAVNEKFEDPLLAVQMS